MKWLDLQTVNRTLPHIIARGVSVVATGQEPSTQTKEGFVEAYNQSKTPNKMKNRSTGFGVETWSERRKNFIARHLKQLREDKNPDGWLPNGSPTNRHLALIAWAYSPSPKRLKKWFKKTRQRDEKSRYRQNKMRYPSPIQIRSG